MDNIRYREAFLVLDEDNTGAITVDDVHFLIRALGYTPTEQDLAKLDQEFAWNKQIDYFWFTEILSKLSCTKYTYGQIENAFFTFDKNRYGLINIEAFKTAMMTLGEPLLEKEMNEMMKDLPVDEDGFIEYESFCSQFRSSEKYQ
ncbi:unnamed protein product [Adineta ricciae]|uniref:EF-hand domain-containing protein n=1 Tax=Adineta ricciae TaxID=249248 RepID=A0A815QDG9_ADIRI|nr:unnamed protein product [Adineta ricciae]